MDPRTKPASSSGSRTGAYLVAGALATTPAFLIGLVVLGLDITLGGLALRLNGGRVGHFSRGFFPDGVRRAVQSLSAYSDATGEPSPWIARIWS